jgi:hypothetical protein
VIPEIPNYIFYTAGAIGFLAGAVWFFCWSAADDAEKSEAKS